MPQVQNSSLGPAENRKEKPASCVYFILAAELGLIKIGKSKNPRTRLQQLKAQSPVRMKLLKAIKGGRILERRLHHRFRLMRHRGEWFNDCRKLRNYIDSKEAVDLKNFDDGSKLIRVSAVVYNHLKRHQRPGESFGDTIRRLLGLDEKPKHKETER
jgi:hypothetical protein